MKRTDPYVQAVWAAEKVIRERNITALPVDPIALARDLGIEVEAKPVKAAGISGMLVRVGNEFGIVYATDIDSIGFRHFTVAHELGHYFLPGHVEAVFKDSDVHESRAGFRSKDQYEAEADHFAAALLMPSQLFRLAIRQAGDGVAAIEYLADLCKTSLPATAIRYAQCALDPLAIIQSEGQEVEFCVMSDVLRELDGIDWLRKRQAVPPGTVTAEFNADRANVVKAARRKGTADLQDWFGGQRSIEMTEGVVGLGSYGKTLTVLHDIELPDEDDEADEEALQQSWTPRFARGR
jgi:hypothetical protein